MYFTRGPLTNCDTSTELSTNNVPKEETKNVENNRIVGVITDEGIRTTCQTEDWKP